ncbi:TraB/GumN family protein [Devosia sp.]|uniref:TraB/GumN family protein n=1 Tax=Devosia sp. TaxID=1871048 RepID=UPI003A913511
MRLLRWCAAPLLIAALSAPALADPALWKVSDADSDIYLFGSVHVFTREMDWRTPTFDRVLADADQVYFEIVLDAEAVAQTTYITLTRGRFHDGESLPDVLTDADWARVVAAAEANQLPADVIAGMQPWFAALALSETAMTGASVGVEQQLVAELPPARMEELETVAEQMGYLADVPLDEQIDNLMSVVESIEDGSIDSLDALLDAWEAGDTDAMLEIFEGQLTPRDAATYERLITDRNERWLEPIEQMLAENSDALVVVGAGHLIGDAGVPALLADKGYTVTRIDAP